MPCAGVFDECPGAECGGELGIRELPGEPVRVAFDSLGDEFRDRAGVLARRHRDLPFGLKRTVMLRPSKLSPPSRCPNSATSAARRVSSCRPSCGCSRSRPRKLTISLTFEFARRQAIA